MIAKTRSAAMTPSSMSFVSSEASATEWIGTLRTSMAEGMSGIPFAGSSVRYDDGAGVSGDRCGDLVEAGDDATAAGRLHEAADGVDLGAHRPGREVPVGGVAAQLLDGEAAERLGVGLAPADDGVRHVGGDDEDVGLGGPGEQGRAEVLVDDGLH